MSLVQYIPLTQYIFYIFTIVASVMKELQVSEEVEDLL